MEEPTPDEGVSEYDLTWELLSLIKGRYGADAIAMDVELEKYDGYVPLWAVLHEIEHTDIPIPAHFEADVAHLVAEHEMEQEVLDLLRKILADQRERGLISY